jgi:hypothetical protein
MPEKQLNEHTQCTVLCTVLDVDERIFFLGRFSETANETNSALASPNF